MIVFNNISIFFLQKKKRKENISSFFLFTDCERNIFPFRLVVCVDVCQFCWQFHAVHAILMRRFHAHKYIPTRNAFNHVFLASLIPVRSLACFMYARQFKWNNLFGLCYLVKAISNITLCIIHRRKNIYLGIKSHIHIDTYQLTHRQPTHRYHSPPHSLTHSLI